VNRLAEATSPYLLQHKDNPVDWWPWCDEAFAEARRRDVPVLLSVGYAACHWCHVMAHESFEDNQIAGVMNAGFVCVKVDREERPDVDSVYMQAVQALSGQGGWPMTVFLTGEGAPFYAGTYFPPTDRGGMPGLPRILTAISAAWQERRAELIAAGQGVVAHLAALARPPAAGSPLDAAILDTAAEKLLAAHDPEWGGFRGAPKFPPALCLEFLLRHQVRRPSPALAAAIDSTCDRMSRGGIYDQLGGGFARYSVDARWVVPHFEKMLYDNALLARLYTRHWRATGAPRSRVIALETAAFLLAELRTAQGGFASSLDADSAGGEGSYYVWTPGELRAVLGGDDGARAAEIFAVTDQGNFSNGASVLTLPTEVEADPADGELFERIRGRLAAARAERPRPPRDDKVVTAWNGLAVAALAEAGALFERPDLIGAAVEAAELLLEVHLVGDRLLRTSRDARPGPSGAVLEDYADLAEGLLALHQADGDPRWLEQAGALLQTVRREFADPAGGFFDTAAGADRLIQRPRDPADNVTPSGASATAGALLSYAALSGSSDAREAAQAALDDLRPLIAEHPRFAGWAAAVGEAALAGPLEVGVVGRPDLARVARFATSPGAVVVSTGGRAPLLAGRPPGAAYVCRGFVCDAPVTEAGRLAEVLAARV
jgi:uncharacterized protein YyaL (SSP411 family)